MTINILKSCKSVFCVCQKSLIPIPYKVINPLAPSPGRNPGSAPGKDVKLHRHTVVLCGTVSPSLQWSVRLYRRTLRLEIENLHHILDDRQATGSPEALGNAVADACIEQLSVGCLEDKGD